MYRGYCVLVCTHANPTFRESWESWWTSYDPQLDLNQRYTEGAGKVILPSVLLCSVSNMPLWRPTNCSPSVRWWIIQRNMASLRPHASVWASPCSRRGLMVCRTQDKSKTRILPFSLCRLEWVIWNRYRMWEQHPLKCEFIIRGLTSVLKILIMHAGNVTNW